MTAEDTPTTTPIAKALEVLVDGEWHTLEELKRKTKLKEKQLAQIIKFLEEYNLIIEEHKTKNIKLEEDFQKLLIQNAKQ
ncbi:MAG: hypothetical protein ACP5IM_02485 [Candidatus Bathyarchaeia archaeon]